MLLASPRSRLTLPAPLHRVAGPFLTRERGIPMTESQKQNFIGGLIGSILVKKGVEIAIDKALDKAAKSPSLSLEKRDVPAVKEIVTDAVEKEVKARVEHVTDTEPHLSSRNMWASFVGIVTAAEQIRMYWTDGQAQTVQEWLIPVGIIVTALTPLYSRFIAKKPLFR